MEKASSVKIQQGSHYVWRNPMHTTGAYRQEALGAQRRATSSLWSELGHGVKWGLTRQVGKGQSK